MQIAKKKKRKKLRKLFYSLQTQGLYFQWMQLFVATTTYIMLWCPTVLWNPPWIKVPLCSDFDTLYCGFV